MNGRATVCTKEYILRHGATVRFLLLAAGVLVTLPVIIDGIRAGEWHHQRLLLLYIAPLWFEAFLWFRARVAEPDAWQPGALALDVAVLGVSALRMIPLPLFPYSGHMLFLVYTALSTRERLYRWTAVVLIAETTVFKLWLWNDWTSWSVGIALGAGSAAAHRSILRSALRRKGTGLEHT